ncbi:MAG: SDR family NAD(P)-dependent oxidoreductase [Mycolicibacterium sp.]|nr:SDR family NAD(P)-dependent oxidoreductase [Mycolicibacterium sp.]
MTSPVAIVTGASSGIGAATARRLAARGYTVYAAARRIDLMAPLASDGVRPVRVDVTDDAALTAFVAQVIAEAGRVDVLVNNAGYGALGALEDVPIAEARRQFEVNLFGLARLVQLVAPHMRRQGGGRIINVSSIGGKVHVPLGGWYHATKFAIEGLSDALRLELAPFGIHVVVIEPGAVNTEWHALAADHLLATSGDGAYASQAAAVSRVLSAAGLGSRPEVIAKAIARAADAHRPRTRYAVALGAKPVLIARRFLPDRTFDRLVRLVFGLVGRAAGNRHAKAVAGRRSA